MRGAPAITVPAKERLPFSVVMVMRIRLSKIGETYYSNNWQYDGGGKDVIGGTTGTKSWRSILEDVMGTSTSSVIIA